MEKEKVNVANVIGIKVSTTELDTAIKKAERLVALLTEANELAEIFFK